MSDDDVMSLYQDPDGTLWAGSDGGGLERLRNGHFDSWSLKDGLLDKDVWAILRDRDGSLWLGTMGGGLARFENGRIVSYTTTKDGLSSDYVDALYEDPDGSIWIGTRGGGLGRLKEGQVTTFTESEGLSKNDVKCVFESRDGSMCIGTEGGWISRLKDGKFTTIGTGLEAETYYSVAEDPDGVLWWATGDENDYRLAGSRLIPFLLKRPGVTLRSILRLRNGETLVGGSQGEIYRVQGGQLNTVAHAEGQIYCLLEDRDGSLWAGADHGGLIHITGQTQSVMRMRQGLPDDTVRALYQDAAGTLWMGTEAGLCRLKDGKLTVYRVKDGLFDEGVYSILEDDTGHLWMSGPKGISRVSKPDLERFASGKIKRFATDSYGMQDGMATSDCEGDGLPTAWKARDGRLWFATAKGVSVIDPDHLRVNFASYPVMIDRIVVDGTSAERPLRTTSDYTSSAESA